MTKLCRDLLTHYCMLFFPTNDVALIILIYSKSKSMKGDGKSSVR